MASVHSFVLLVALLGGVFNLSLGSSVPALYWSTGERHVHQFHDVFAGQTLSAKVAFESHIQPFLKKANYGLTIMFIQDQMSMEDFRTHAGSFVQISQACEKFRAAMLPSVSSDKQSVSQLIYESFGGHVKDIYSSELHAWVSAPSIPENCRLLVIHLPPVAGSSDFGRSEVLQGNDKLVHEVLGFFEQKAQPVSVIITALAPSEKISLLQSAEEMLSSDLHSPRHLLSHNPSHQATKLYNVSDCLYISFSDMVFTLHNFSVSLVNASISVTGSGCHEIELSATDSLPVGITSFKFKLQFANTTGGDWTCANASVEVDMPATGLKNSSLSCGASRLDDLQLAIYAPSKMSYACMNTTLLGGNGTTTVTLSNLQIQPFAQPRKWGGVFNCATFFTLPILSALMVTLLLATGMLIGLFTISAIQTPDRFDDPKGPMISVPTQE